MLENIVYVLLAIIGLGFLVFIHELGHYFAAKKEKMKIEVFSIGFGKPLISWKRKDVTWQIGIFPFGGYVKIAGMEKKGKKEPYEIKDGFFSKKPLQRIKVALCGPISNFIFAFIAFSILWISGGRDKNFSEYTKKIGYVEKRSPLYENKVRAGDTIKKYNHKKYRGFGDVLYNSALSKKYMSISGDKEDYYHNKKTDFEYLLKSYSIKLLGHTFSSIGIGAPCSFLIYSEDPSELFPIKKSGIQKNDRIIWADGELIFSLRQLSDTINDGTSLIKFLRDGKLLLARVPKVKVSDLKISLKDINEIDDARYDVGIREKLKDIYFIPYFFSEKGIVEKRIDFIDEEDVYELDPRNKFSIFLSKGDQIIEIDGKKVGSFEDILKNLQKKYVQIIVQRNFPKEIVSWKKSDELFDGVFKKEDLLNLILSDKKSSGDLIKLEPVKAVTLEAFSNILGKDFQEGLQNHRQEIEKIKDPEQKSAAMQIFEKEKNRLVLGVFSIQDQKVRFNPNPFSLFYSSLMDSYRTLFSLITGKLNIKWMSGPIGIVQVVHKGWSLGILEAFFWLGVISLNLGFINLLPIPVLDGGHIVFSLYEMVTKKRISSKAMERWIIPFIVLLVILFIFITYNDIVRLVKKFF